MKNKYYFLFLIFHLLVGCGKPVAIDLDSQSSSAISPDPTAPVPNPTIAPLVCNSDPDTWTPATVKHKPSRADVVNDALTVLRAIQPDLFDGDRISGNCDSTGSVFFIELAKVIRTLGVCAWAGPDAIHPASTIRGFAEEYHIVNYGGCKLYPASSDNYKGDWVITDFVP